LRHKNKQLDQVQDYNTTVHTFSHVYATTEHIK